MLDFDYSETLHHRDRVNHVARDQATSQSNGRLKPPVWIVEDSDISSDCDNDSHSLVDVDRGFSSNQHQKRVFLPEYKKLLV